MGVSGRGVTPSNGCLRLLACSRQVIASSTVISHCNHCAHQSLHHPISHQSLHPPSRCNHQVIATTKSLQPPSHYINRQTDPAGLNAQPCHVNIIHANANCSALNACIVQSEVIKVSLIGSSQSPWLVRDLDGVGIAPAQVSRTIIGPCVPQPPRRRRQQHEPRLRTPPWSGRVPWSI